MEDLIDTIKAVFCINPFMLIKYQYDLKWQFHWDFN